MLSSIFSENFNTQYQRSFCWEMIKKSITYPLCDQDGQIQKEKRIEQTMLKYNLEYVSRLGFPTRLKPGEATIDDIAVHALMRQRLKNSTVTNRIRSLQRMQKHQMPINIQQPDYTEWINHADYREQIENAKSRSSPK